MQHDQPAGLDDHAVELLAARLMDAVRQDLHALLEDLVVRAQPEPGLTVEQVAACLGVKRSTVYAHWREWGGYKLGRGGKAPIRFDAARLPSGRGTGAPPPPGTSSSGGRKRGSARALITDAPRLTPPLDEAA